MHEQVVAGVVFLADFLGNTGRCVEETAAPHKVLLLVRPGGFEPLAFRVGAERSIQLSYDRLYMKNAVTAYFNLVKDVYKRQV